MLAVWSKESTEPGASRSGIDADNWKVFEVLLIRSTITAVSKSGKLTIHLRKSARVMWVLLLLIRMLCKVVLWSLAALQPST